MALSDNLITQFAKAINQEDKKDEGVTLKATYKKINGKDYVYLDGSDILTPVETAVDAETDDRVQVLIKDHSATLISNITSPAARSKSVQDLKAEVDEYGNTIQQMDNSIIQQGNSIIQLDNRINQQGNTINQHNNIINQQGDQITSMNNVIIAQGNSIEANNNAIIMQGNSIDSMNNTITQHGDNITSLNNVVNAQGNIINAQGNTIDLYGNNITAINSNIQILDSGFVIQNGVLTGLSKIIIDALETDVLQAEYATIDFANINMAAVTKIFSDSGIIDDLIVQQGKITGELVGVTIKGDLIEAGTLKADRLVVLGSDGLYYKLNIDGIDNVSTTEAAKFVLTSSKPSDWDTNYTDYYVISNNKYIHVTGASAPTWTSNTYYKLSSTYESGLDGTNIVAHSITADKVQVSDLVAFGATIGGFDISDDSIHTHTKTSISSDINGLYFDKYGQMYLGDNHNHIKYYLDTTVTPNKWKLDVAAEEISFGANGTSLSQELETIKEETTVNLVIESSNGLVFKNNSVSTVLSAIIYRGFDRITDMTTLRQKMGNSVYLQWKYKRIEDQSYSVISSTDSRLSEDGFKFTLSPQDVDTQITFICELEKN